MKVFGTKKDHVVIMVKEELLNLDVIRQIRNYLEVKEKELKGKEKK